MANPYAAFRSLERFLPHKRSDPDRAIYRDPAPIKDILGYCANCRPGGSHVCTGKGLSITMVYDLTGHDQDRIERKEISCCCERCHPKGE